MHFYLKIILGVAIPLACPLPFSGQTIDPPKEKTWQPPAHSKVKGYEFKMPVDSRRLSKFTSVLTEDSIRTELLKQATVKSAVLNVDQAAQLVTAINTKTDMMGAYCYNPHHIFVFYDENDKPLSAIEVCFSCTNFRTWPAMTLDQIKAGDWARLASITDQLGLWKHEKYTADEWKARYIHPHDSPGQEQLAK